MPFIFVDTNVKANVYQCTDLFILHAINHPNEEPTGAFDPLMAGRG